MPGLPPETLFNHPLAYVRARQEWSLGVLAALLAARTGRSAARQKVYRWERGVEPEMEAQVALAAELHVPEHMLFTHRWPDWLPVGDRVPRDAPWTDSDCIRVLVRTVEASPVDRRGFLTLTAGGASELATEWAGARAPAQEAVSQDASRVVTDLESRLPILRSLESKNGGEASRYLLDDVLREAITQLRGDRLRLADRPRLAAVVCELARISGWAHVDAGRHAAAEHRFFAGLRAAHLAGDRLAGANLLKCVSLLLVEHGRRHEALDVMDVAVRQSAGGPKRIQAMLTVRQARVLAALGSSRKCEELLARAERLMDQVVDSDDEPGWATYFDRAEFSSQVASCHLALGHPEKADEWLEHGVGLQSGDGRRDGITYQMWRAECAVRIGEVDRSCALIRQALPGMAEVISVRNHDRLRRVQLLLKPFQKEPSVADLMTLL